MEKLKWLFELFKWLLMTERQQVSAKLKVRPLKAFVHPREVPAPSVDHETRCYLEQFRHYNLDGYLPGLSKNNQALAQRALNELISARTYRALFPMAFLHGFTASKSSMSTNRTRASQPTMAAMGRLVDDLRDLKGKEGGDIIDACLAWGELRLNQGIRLTTDNWHKRYYWSNSGGSHHMAVLCYELQRQNKDWSPEVEIREYVLDVGSLACLTGRVSIFVVMRDQKLYGYEQVFERLPQILQHEEVRAGLGVSVPSPSHYRLPFSEYQLVLVDHSQAYADIALARLQEAVGEGVAMPFCEFLEAWISPDEDHLAKPVALTQKESAA